MHFNSAATPGLRSFFTTGRFMSSAERIVRANAARGGNNGQGGKNSGNVIVALFGAAWAAAYFGGKYVTDGNLSFNHKVPWMPGPDGVVQADGSPGQQSDSADADEQTMNKPDQPGSPDLKDRAPLSGNPPQDLFNDPVPWMPPYLSGHGYNVPWMANIGQGSSSANEDGTTQAKAVDEQPGLRTSSRGLPPSWARPR